MSTISKNSEINPILLENQQKLKLFCRQIELNRNNFVSSEFKGEDVVGCRITINSVNGIKKNISKHLSNQYSIRFSITFYNSNSKQFFGNTIMSKKLKIKFNNSGHFELDDEVQTFYFFNNLPENQNVVLAVIEIIFVEMSNENVISKTCSGWSFFEVKNLKNSEKRFEKIYYGSSRNLNHSDKGITNCIEGASISYVCSEYLKINHFSFLLPNFVLFLQTTLIPGLCNHRISSDEVKDFQLENFQDVFMKNIEIELPQGMEMNLLNHLNNYRIAKYDLNPESNLNPVTIKERKLRCSFHNTWKFINSSGLENTVQLNKQENILFTKNVHCIDNYYFDNDFKSAFIFELVYTVVIPIKSHGSLKEEKINLSLGYGFYFPNKLSHENIFRSIYFITGNATTVYGDHLFPLELGDQDLKVNFVLSLNKDSYDKTYKEEEISKLQNEIHKLRQNLEEDKSKPLTDNLNTEKTKKLEQKIRVLENKLLNNKQSLKAVYDKDSNIIQMTFEGGHINTKNLQYKDMMNNNIDKKDENSNYLKNSISKYDENFKSKNVDKLFDEEEILYGNEAIPEKNDLVELPQINQISSSNKINHEINYVSVEGNKNLTEKILNNNSNYIHDNKLNYESKRETNNLNTKVSNNLNDLTREELINLIHNQNKTDENSFRENFRQNKMQSEIHLTSESYNDLNIARDISLGQQADFISKGILNLDYQAKNEKLLMYTLENELKDERKSNNYVFHFIAFKPSIKKEIPNKLKFAFSFWDFDTLQPDLARVLVPNENYLVDSAPLLLVKEDYIDEKEIKIRIQFDPSSDPFTDFKEFMNFVLHRSLIVEIFDADKLFKIGYFKIILKHLLRNGKSIININKEYNIYNNDHKIIGSLIMNIQCEGLRTKKKFIYDPKKFKIVHNNYNHLNSDCGKKKKIKVKQFDLDQLNDQQKELLGNEIITKNSLNFNKLNENNKNMQLKVDPETQKKLRVVKYSNLLKSAESEVLRIDREKLDELKMKQVMDDQFYNALNLANRLKFLKRNSIIEKTIQENNNNTLNISLISGKAHYFNYLITNPFNFDENFKIIISSNTDKEMKNSNLLQEETIQIINRSEIWEEILNEEKEHNLIAPKDYYHLSINLNFILKPGETIPILVKLLSYDTSISNKNFTIWIYRSNQQPLEFLSINIIKVFNIIDHKFVFNIPDNRISTLRIPNPYKSDINKSNLIIDNQISSNIAFHLNLDPTTRDFLIRFKPNEINNNKIENFFIYLYLNKLKSEILFTFEITVSMLETIDIHTKIGSKVAQKIYFEDNERRTVQCFSSDLKTLFFTEKGDNPFILIPNIPNEIKMIIFPKTNSQKEVIINCVDLASKDLIKSYLIRIIPENPNFEHVIRIDSNVGNSNNIKYEYTSQMSRWCILNFESNNEEILKV